jgi:SWI/SNF-related matrix-associated actin-dependent regulator of chromatin subfamily A member 5
LGNFYTSNNFVSTITNDDIDEILRRGEAKTAELDSKYKSMGFDDVKTFKEAGSIFEWEGSDFRNQKKEAGFRWIQPAKRDKRSKKKYIYNF